MTTTFIRRLMCFAAMAWLVAMPRRVHAADDLSVVSELLQDELIKANDDYWSEQNRKDIDLLRAQLRATSKKETNASSSALSATQSTFISTLERVMVTQAGNSVRLRAQVELAAFYLYQLNNVEKARATLAAYEVNSDDVKPSLYTRYLILSSDVAVKGEDYKTSTKALAQADKFIASAGLSDEFEEAVTLRLANTSFASFEYEKSVVFYKRYLSQAQVSAAPRSREGIVFAKARLVSSYFKLGEYKRVVDSARDYFSSIREENRNKSKELSRDVMGLVATALYERFDKADYSKLLKDEASPESFDAILQAFDRIVSAGRVEELDSIANFVEPSFVNNRAVVRFYEIWLASLKQSGKLDRWAAVAHRAVKVAAKGTQYARDVIANATLEASRSQFIVNTANEAGEFYYLRAKNFNDESDYATCSDLYDMRSSESQVLYGEHAIRFVECLYGSKQFDSAWKMSELTLKRPLNRAQSLALFDIRVLVARDAATAALSSPESLLRYQNAVELFLSAFPLELSARSGGYELSQKLIGLEKYFEAKLLLERLMSILPTNGSVQDNDLRDKLLSVCLLLNVRGSSLADDTISQSKLESLARKLELDTDVLDEVQAANAASIRLLASQLRREGRMLEGAQALRQWCLHHSQNIEAAAVCLEAVRAAAEVGDMWQVESLSQHLLKVYSNAPERFEAWYWQGKSMEHKFAFEKALYAYSQSVLVKDSLLSDKKRLDLLESAQSIASDLKNYVMAARFQEELLNLQIKIGKDINRSVRWSLASSESWVKADRIGNASRALKTVYQNSKFSIGNKFKTQLADIMLDLNSPLKRIEGRRRLDAFIETTSKRLKEQTNDEASKDFLSRALALAFSTDIFEFDALDADDSSRLSDAGLSKRAATFEASLKRLDKVESYLQPEVRMQVQKHLSQLSERLSDTYNLVARRSSTTTKQEEYARAADGYFLQARKFGFESMGESSRWDNKIEPDLPVMTPGESVARRKRNADRNEVSR